MVKIAALVCLLDVFSAAAQNLIVNGDFGIGDLTGWTTTPAAPATIIYDGGLGNPAGAATLARNDTTADANGNYLYQIVPVVIGQQYKLSADWQGDLLNGLGVSSRILLESSCFDHVNTPWANYNTTGYTRGIIHWKADNVFVSTTIPAWAPNSTVFTPPYPYVLDSGSSVKTTVTNYAGTGKGPFAPHTLS